MSFYRAPMRLRARRTAFHAGLVAAAFSVGATSAMAAEAYIQNGIGARNKALAGAGVASSTDATAASLNPAGLVNVESQANVALSILDVRGGTTASPATAPGQFNPDGWSKSDPDAMYIPNFAATWRVNWGLIDAVAFTGYGIGGVNTHYKAMPNGNCIFGGAGVFCGGDLGIKLVQEHYSIAVAKNVGQGVSVGIAPVVARQYGKIFGTGMFADFGLSSDAANFSDRGTDESWGFGVRGGVEWKATPGITVGVAASSKFDMQRFEKYQGLLAERGDFDIPPMLQVGVAFDLTRDLKLLVDYKHIWFSQVTSASNPSTIPPQIIPFGLDNAAGYGVQNLDVVKFGFECQAMASLTLRGGYSYNTAPLKSRDADLNIMTLGVVQHHITGGFKYALTNSIDIEFATMYAPEEKLRGIELMTADRGVEIEGSQLEFTIGTTYRFGGAD